MNFEVTQQRLGQYQPALDGLRAVAVLWVLLHNGAYYPALNYDSPVRLAFGFLSASGWLGVQMFFVLSGFLITGILLDAKKSQVPQLLKRFYARRFLRIFPVYYFTLFVLLVCSLILVEQPRWLQQVEDSFIWFALYLVNWVQPLREVGLGHFWSLAVEEQFYILWPFAVLGLSMKRLYWLSLGMIVLALAFRWIFMLTDPQLGAEVTYVVTPARMDALAIGAALAIMLRHEALIRHVPECMRILAILGGCYFVLVIVLEQEVARVSASWPVLNQTIFALLFSAMVYYALDLGRNSRGHKLAKAFFGLAVLRNIGKYSYAIYLFHLPVVLLLHQWVTPVILESLGATTVVSGTAVYLADQVLLFCLSYGLAWLSWRVIETPFLNLKHRWPMHAERSSPDDS